MEDDSPFFERNVSKPVLFLREPDWRVGNLGFFLGDTSSTDSVLGTMEGDDDRCLFIWSDLIGDPETIGLFPKNPSIPC